MTTPPIPLNLTSDQVFRADLVAMATMYLPDDDIGNRWALERFLWRPSDASLAALPFPLAHDTDALDPDGPTSSTAGPLEYMATAALTGIPDPVNPGNAGLGFVAGSLTAMKLRIRDKTITAELSLSRRVPNAGGGTVHTSSFAVTYQDVATDFPTVTYADVHPAISYYELRLVHP